MSTYNIQWSATLPAQLASERYAQFFAFEMRGELVFVGKGYRENLAEAVQAQLEKLQLTHDQVTVHLGRIREVGLGRISGVLVDAILGMLLFAKKPKLNTSGKYRFQGLLDLQLSNIGCLLLPSRLRAENNRVIVGPKSTVAYANPILAC